MAPSTSTSSIIQELLRHNDFHSRRMLHHNPLYNSPPLSLPPSSNPNFKDNTLDTNVVMVLSVLLCALICSFGINSIIKCALRCSTLVATADSPTRPTARLANTGIKKKALKTFPVITYAADLKNPGMDTECVICLSGFASGERIRVLPKCHHGFHVKCIDKWLNSHSSCPTCRHCLIETCNKIVGCTSSQSSGNTSTVLALSPPLREAVISIEPLQREGVIRNYQT